MRLPIRTRLTLWYTGLFFLLLGVYVAAVFAFQYVQLHDQVYSDEVQEIEAVEGLLYWNPQGELRLHDEYYSHPKSRILVDRLLEVRDIAGDVLYRSDSLHGEELGLPRYANEGKHWFERRTATLADGRTVLFASHLHPVQGRMVLIRLGYDLAPMRDRMWRFLGLLLIALPPSVLVAAWAGHRLANKAFDPLQKLAEAAEQITARNLHARLPVSEPAQDELERVTTVVNDLLARLEKSFQRLEQFTADVAHELRTPLAALRLSGEEALLSESPANLTQTIGSMLEESDRLIETVNGLLLLSRTEARSPEHAMRIFSLRDLVQEILSVLEVLIDERGLRVETTLSVDEFKDVCGDRTLTQSALMNVLHNAIRFAPPGSTIRLSYDLASHAGVAMQQLCIEDEGPGLEPGEHARIFERFYRGTNQGDAPGAGLGLAIARMAMEHSHGYIFADATYKGGLRCCVALPLAPSGDRP